MIKIFLVDDNADLRYSIKKGIESRDKSLEIIPISSGRKCLSMLKKNKPDLILLDIMMPGMDGWDTCAKIKEDKKNQEIPIVFLTAKSDPVSKSMGSLASSDYITKPFEIEDLVARINKILFG